MVNNIDRILPFLVFHNKDDFYYLQILQRKKENPQLGSNSRVIKNYYIRSKEHLLSRYEEIKDLCTQFNARAFIRLNKRSFEKVAFKTMVNLANTMNNKEYGFISKSYDRACGSGHNDSEKKWILDVDKGTKNSDLLKMEGFLNEYLKDVQPIGDKELAMIPSKTGFHIISKPFDLREFKKDFPDVEIHKDNPTNLFIS